MRVWITRAEPGAARTAREVVRLGHDPVIMPVLRLETRPAAPPPDDVAAVAFTSGNAVAAVTAGALSRRDLPVFAVGDATARAAREAGFGDVVSAGGDGSDLARLLAERGPRGPVLWPRAEDVAFDLAAALAGRAEVRPWIVYGAAPTPFVAPADFEVVLVHSPRAARALADRLAPDLARRRTAAAISEAAAAPLTSLPFRAVAVAARPDEPSLMAALGKAAPAV